MPNNEPSEESGSSCSFSNMLADETSRKDGKSSCDSVSDVPVGISSLILVSGGGETMGSSGSLEAVTPAGKDEKY